MEEKWFESPLKPDASIGKLMAVNPTGMSNPPRNPVVRQLLMQDLANYGVSLDYKQKWPPVLPDCCKPAGASKKLHQNAMLALAARARSMMSTRSSSSTKWHSSSVHLVQAEDVKQKPSSPPRQAHSLPQSPQGLQEGDGRQGEADGLYSPARTMEGFKPKGQHSNVNDTDLRSQLEALRAMKRMHKAEVNDQFRFVADGASGSMVIQGAASQLTSLGAWASEGAVLTKLHNRAMRTVNPSHLELLPQDTYHRKKKKDADDMDVSGFKPLYKSDPAYRLVRTLRRDMSGRT